MKNYIVVLQLVVESYDPHGSVETPNTQHSCRRIYASLPCDESEVQAAVERVAEMLKLDHSALTLESEPAPIPQIGEPHPETKEKPNEQS